MASVSSPGGVKSATTRLVSTTSEVDVSGGDSAGANLAIVDYRGYGESTGTPNLRNFVDGHFPSEGVGVVKDFHFASVRHRIEPLLLVYNPGTALPYRQLNPNSRWGGRLGTLYNKYHGETEKNLREALASAEQLAPCVLWIDELEKGISTDSGEGDGGVSRRVLGSLLTWMNERRAAVFLVAGMAVGPAGHAACRRAPVVRS